MERALRWYPSGGCMALEWFVIKSGLAQQPPKTDREGRVGKQAGQSFGEKERIQGVRKVRHQRQKPDIGNGGEHRRRQVCVVTVTLLFQLRASTCLAS